jgi:hypothetical protein
MFSRRLERIKHGDHEAVGLLWQRYYTVAVPKPPHRCRGRFPYLAML